MAIKSKRYNKWLKATVFLGTVVLAVLATLLFIEMEKRNYSLDLEDVNKQEYVETVSFERAKWNVNQALGIVVELDESDFTDEAIAKRRETLKREVFEERKFEVSENYLNEKGLFEIYEEGVNQRGIYEGEEVEATVMLSVIGEHYLKENNLNEQELEEGVSVESLAEDLLWQYYEENFQASYVLEVESRLELVKEQFRAAQETFRKQSGIYYAVEQADGSILTNHTSTSMEAFLAHFDHAYHYAKDIYRSEMENSKAAFAFSNAYIAEQTKLLADFKIQLLKGVLLLSGFFLCLGYLIYAAGKKSDEPDGIHLLEVDRLYNEFTALFLFLSGLGVIGCATVLYAEAFFEKIMLLLLAISYTVSIGWLLMMVRHLKNRTLIRNSLCYTICAKIYHALRKIYNLGTPMIKLFVAILILGLLTMIPFVGLITLPLISWLAYRQMKKFLQLKAGVQAIHDGAYETKIAIAGEGEFAQVAKNVNGIAGGLTEEVERRLKSERMKTELIVNVSHDIRTPLTSLVTYVDLLKQEAMSTEEARQYLDVIASKTDRLKVLIDDLFEAAKAASGNLQVTLEKVELESLITQGLGELDDKIKASELDFHIQLAKEKVYVHADGKLLWRVIENLLSNVLKYSLKNSRVYLDILEDEQNAIVEIKNISAQQLNIPEDEIMERFKRGDLARTSEGSGLGLDIARSLMICQGGRLDIKIDGDLFKARVTMEKYRNSFEQ